MEGRTGKGRKEKRGRPSVVPGAGASRRTGASRREWIGGRLVSPFYITEETPYRPELILWLEMPDELILHSVLVDPKATPVSFGETLLQAATTPMVGRPRQPSTVRVADPDLAAEVRRVLPEVEVVVAPTPELDQVLALMGESLLESDSDGESSYFEDGRIPAEVIAELFRIADVLFAVAPWKQAADQQVLRVDIPAYEVEGACLSIIGALGESLGLILFPSRAAMGKFLDAAERPRGKSIDLGTSSLALNFEAGSDLPPTMLREAMKYGWPVAGPKAYPVVQHRDRDATLRPLTERDVRVMTACAASLAAFFARCGGLFEQGVPDEPVCVSWFNEDDLEVRFTYPYEAGALFKINAGPPTASATRPRPGQPAPPRPASASRVTAVPAPKFGRNQACPCGSGKKYKNCCLRAERRDFFAAQERAARAGAEDGAAAVHGLDRSLVDDMTAYARRRFGQEWLMRSAEAFRDPGLALPLLQHWSFYHVLVRGRTVAEWFLNDPEERHSEAERSWLEAQRAAWLSVWEVLDLEPGKTITLRDLLTSEERVVVEAGGSRTLEKRDTLLARVIDHEGVSVLAGVHVQPLPPRGSAEAVSRMRARLRRKGSVPTERLREENTGRDLIGFWEDGIENCLSRVSKRPEMRNTDGESLLFTTDHYVFGPIDIKEIRRRLMAIPGMQPPPSADDPELVYVFSREGNAAVRSMENTILGTATISANKLRLESNSLKRADSLRKLVEKALEPLVRHRGRDHADPVARLGKGSRGKGRPARAPSSQPEIPPDEMNRLVLEFKAKHYAGWADDPLPALEGKTPREAIKTKAGREQVDLLLREFENGEARMPAGQRYDFSGLRRELGLEG